MEEVGEDDGDEGESKNRVNRVLDRVSCGKVGGKDHHHRHRRDRVREGCTRCPIANYGPP